MEHLNQSFTIKFDYKVHFTSELFHKQNTLLNDFLAGIGSIYSANRKILFVLDEGVANTHASLVKDIKVYFAMYNSVNLVPDILSIPGGEKAKNNPEYLDEVLEAAIDRLQLA